MASRKFSNTDSYLDDSVSSIFHPDHDEVPFKTSNRTNTSNMDTDTMREPRVPVHPIPAFQAAFAESMVEASRAPIPRPQHNLRDATARRKVLLDQEPHEETHASRWKQKPGQRFHALWKLMSQISFGVYLLLNGIAKDDEQVLHILQGHVDEVDQFLETTLDDFDLAQKDIDERLNLLKVPLSNIQVFETMLEGREFRLQIVNGNERIEHIITRTTSAMNDALEDVEEGIGATRQFIVYLTEEDEDSGWKEEQPEMIRVFDAMKGNANGWHRAFGLLQTKGEKLGASLVHLGSIVNEMSRRAGEVSRRQRFSNESTYMSPPASPPRDPPRDLHRENHNTNQKYLNNQNIIPPKVQETLPALRYGERHELSSDSIAQKEAQRPKLEPQIYTLQPTTYSPIPSPSRTPVLKEESPERKESPPPPQNSKRKNSLRHRFSLKRNSKSPIEIEQHRDAPPISHHHDQQPIEPINPPLRSTQLLTPPTSGRGPDSAYFSASDTDKIYVSGGISTPTYDEKLSFPPLPQAPYTRQIKHRPSLPRLDSDSSYKSHGVPSPGGSESRIHLRPVHANPNSPLQRPWTAAPDDRRAPPSRMGMSTMSEVTSSTSLTHNSKEGEKKPKKKKSAFNWFKKAFSLSEEEKAAFEARRRMPDPRPEDFGRDTRPLFLDGKRVREGYGVQYREREGALTRGSQRVPTRDGPVGGRSSTRQHVR